jgi:hypothetical protein
MLLSRLGELNTFLTYCIFNLQWVFQYTAPLQIEHSILNWLQSFSPPTPLKLGCEESEANKEGLGMD